MDARHWFTEEYKKRTGNVIKAEDVGCEAIELFQDEIGPEFIPPEHLTHLPDPMLIETLVYEDPDGNEWIAGIVLCGTPEDGLYTFWTKNGQSITRQFTNAREGEEA